MGIGSVEPQAVAVGHGQDVEDVLPAVDLAGGVGPVGSSFADGEVENLQGGLLVREGAAASGGGPEPRVQGLDRYLEPLAGLVP